MLSLTLFQKLFYLLKFAQRTLKKREWNDCMSQESGRTRKNECLLQMPGQLHLGTRQDQTSGRSCIEGTGAHVPPTLVEEVLTVDGFWGRESVSFLIVCGPW